MIILTTMFVNRSAEEGVYRLQF